MLSMWARKLTIENLNLAGQRVVIRVDFNVPMHEGKISNNKKILSGIDSIVYALVKNANSVMILSHLGKPRGRKIMKYSLAPVAEELDSLLKQVQRDPESLGKYSQIFKLFAEHPTPSVQFLSDCIGSQITEACSDPDPGSIFLFENVKFYAEEEGFGLDSSGNKIYTTMEATNLFRKSLRNLGDVFINDAFSISHHAYSSILGTGFEKRAAGLLLNKEIRNLSKVMYKPEKPYLAILGGIKVIDKYNLIYNLLDKVSEIIIAGAMAFPFLRKLKRMHTGHSMFDADGCKVVKALMKKAKKNRVAVHFPIDFLTSSKLGALRLETIKSGIEDEWMGLDIGPESCILFRRVILRAKMILWNGPPGAYELDHFQEGSECMLYDIVKATSRGATSILVGEDTAACAIRYGQENNVTQISSGGHRSNQLYQHGKEQFQIGPYKTFYGVKNKQNEQPVPLCMEKGDTVFLHPLLVHGSGPNRSKRFRKAISCHYAASECQVVDVKNTPQEHVAREVESTGTKSYSLSLDFQSIMKLRSLVVRGSEGFTAG